MGGACLDGTAPAKAASWVSLEVPPHTVFRPLQKEPCFPFFIIILSTSVPVGTNFYTNFQYPPSLLPVLGTLLYDPLPPHPSLT